MCTGCSPTVAFSWLGGLLVNGSFVALISWGTASFWPMGLTLALLYTALLFSGAAWLLKRERSPSIAISMLLLLGVLGVGTSGLILAYNAFGCSTASSDGSTLVDWTFLPPAINASAALLAWASADQWSSGSLATFAHAAAAGATFFAGRGSSNGREVLWRSDGAGVLPLDDSLQSPRSLVVAGGGTYVCFVAYAGADAVHCYDGAGAAYTTIVAAAGSAAPRSPRALLVDGDGTLWFKSEAPFGMSPASGVAFRADPTLTTATLVSIPQLISFWPPPPPPAAPGQPAPTDGACDAEGGSRAQALATLLLASLPALVTSIALWLRLDARAPSMALAAFLGASAVVLNAYWVVEPGGDGAYEVLR